MNLVLKLQCRRSSSRSSQVALPRFMAQVCGPPQRRKTRIGKGQPNTAIHGCLERTERNLRVSALHAPALDYPLALTRVKLALFGKGCKA